MGETADTGLTASFRLLQQSASSVAERTDTLFTAMLLLCGGMAVLLLCLVVGFSIRWRRGSSAHRSASQRSLKALEIAWTAVPLLIFLGLFVWGAKDFVEMHRTPANALPVMVVAKQWMWTLQQRNGRREINELHVPLGQPVELLMTSQDAIHSVFVPAFRLKQDVLPGRYTTLWFKATQLGEFRLFCAEYCGSEHSQMVGRVVVMPTAEFARWLDAGPPTPSLASYGFALYRQLGCAGCHDAESTVRAPSLDGLYGRSVALSDGRNVVADDNYLRDAIVQPARDVVAGQAPVMPSYANQISEEDLQALVAYIRSRAASPTHGDNP